MQRSYADHIKIILAFSMAIIASLGTMPYGFRFAQGLAVYNHQLAMIIGGILAIAAAVCNIALGSSSLLTAKFKQKEINPFYILIISLAGALPNGFMFYFAYQDLFPLIINVFASIAVTLINAGIGYTAMFTVICLMKKIQFKIGRKEICQCIGALLGLIASLTVYAAAVHGLTNLFAVNIEKALAFKLASFIGIITWLPNAALFSNAMREATGKFYDFFADFSVNLNKVNKGKIALFVFVCCSGASFVQIAYDFFGLQMNIPDILKTPTVQLMIHKVVFPLTFITSTAVNYFALQNVLAMNSKQANFSPSGK